MLSEPAGAWRKTTELREVAFVVAVVAGGLITAARSDSEHGFVDFIMGALATGVLFMLVALVMTNGEWP